MTATLTATHRHSVPGNQGIKFETSVVVERPAAELYAFWRDFRNLPQFMKEIKGVTIVDATSSHWVAVGPLGIVFQWNAEVVNDHPGELIAWRTLDKADLHSAGTVRFTGLEGGKRTKVRMVVEYLPPGGVLGNVFASLIIQNPEKEMQDDLVRFKNLMESGLPTPAAYVS
jgi:uncharacterized membrane protein